MIPDTRRGSLRFASFVGIALASLTLLMALASAAPEKKESASLHPSTAPLATTRSSGSTIPTAAEIATAEQIVRSVFAAAFTPPTTAPTSAVEIAARIARQADFARRLFRQSMFSEDDRALRYVLLRESRDLAAGAGDSMTALKAVWRMQSLYGVDPMESHDAALAALTVAGKAAASPDDVLDNAQGFLQFIEAAMAVGDDDLASRAVTVAKPTAERVDLPLLQRLLKSPEVKALDAGALATEATAARAAIESLRTAPDDAQANLTAGRFLCFNRGNWSVGLPLLLRGSDANLKLLAQRDLDQSIPGGARADMWWLAAEAQTGRIQTAMRRRSCAMACEGWPALKGEHKTPLDRLKTLDQFHRRPGLITDLYDGEWFNRYRSTRLDARVHFDLLLGSPDSRVGGDYYSIAWSGMLQAPEKGTYEIEGEVDDGVYVRFSGADIVSRWDKLGKFEATAELTTEPKPFYVLFHETRAPAYVHLRWKPPGAEKAVGIPPSAFSHPPIWPWGTIACATSGRAAKATRWLAPGGKESDAVWYNRFGRSMTWQIAERFCEEQGGHLPIVRRPEQREGLLAVAGGGAVWIGASDNEIEGWWVWQDGTHVDPALLSWGEGEPGGGTDENFAAIEKNKGWADWSGRNPFICQWDR